MGQPIVLDANFFFVKQTKSSQSLLQEFQRQGSFNFHVTHQIKQELKSLKLDESIVNVMQVEHEEIRSIKNEKLMTHPPQDSDLSLIVAAKKIQIEQSKKNVIIVSNDFKLAKFVEIYGRNLEVVPVPIFAYQLAVRSSQPALWRKIGRRSLNDYISYNRKRSTSYNIEEIIVWIIGKMADLLDKKKISLEYAITPSTADFDTVRLIINGEKIDLDQFPYLRSVSDFIGDYQDIMSKHLAPIAHPKTLTKKEISIQHLKLKKLITMWTEFLLASHLLPEFDQTLINHNIRARLIPLYQLLLEYELEGYTEENIPSLMLELKRQCIETRDFASLFNATLLIIVYYLKTGDYDFALFNCLNGLKILPEIMFDERIQLNFLSYRIIADKHVAGDEESFRKNVEDAHEVDPNRTVQAINFLGNFLFVRGIYEFALRIYTHSLKQLSHHSDKNILRLFRRIIVCEKMLQHPSIKIFEMTHELAEKFRENQDLFMFFKNETAPDQPNRRIWSNYTKKDDTPLLANFRSSLHILAVTPERDGFLIDTDAGIFEIQVPNEVITQNIALSPYDYVVTINSRASFTINEPTISNSWLVGCIICQSQEDLTIKLDDL